MSFRRWVAAAFALSLVVDATFACSRERGKKADKHVAGGANTEHGEASWPAHGTELPELTSAAAQLPGEIVVAGEEETWRLELRSRRVESLAPLATALGPEVRLFPTAAARGARALWIAARGHEPQHAEQLAVQDGATLKVVGPVAQQVRHPALTPDGAAVIFESSHGSFRDLYMLSLQGEQLVRLTDNREGNFEPSLAPEGDAVAFASSRDGDSEIYVLQLPEKAPAGLPSATRLTAFHRDDFSPAFGPGGAVAFVSDREGADRVFVVRKDGTQLARASAEAAAQVTEASPAWSKGASLAYLRIEAGRAALVVGDPAKRQWRTLTPPGHRVLSYAWEPSGEWLAAVEAPAAQSAPATRVRPALWAIRRDGSERVLVLPAIDEAAVVRWHPGSAAQ